MGKRVWRKCATAALCIAVVATALRADQLDTIALTGQAAPGTAGGVYGSIGVPMIDAAGALSFRASLTGASDGSTQGLFLLDGAGTSINIARVLQPAPGGGGGMFSQLSSPVLNGNVVTFNGQFTGSSDGSAMGIFQATGSGPLSAIVRDKQTAPGSGGGTFGTTFLGAPASVNAAGQVVFYDNFTGSSDGSSFGVFRGTGGTLNAIMRDKQAAPGGGTFTTALLGAPQINSSGLVADTFGLTGSADGATQEVFRGDGATNIAIARQGQSASGTGGGTFNNFSSPLINDFGNVDFAASLFGTTDGSTEGIFAGSGATPSVIVREKQAAPGTGGGAFNASLNLLALNGNGELLFQAGLTSTSDGSTTGLFRGNGVSTTAIARERQAAPGGGSFTNAFSSAGLNSSGDVAFQANLSGSPDGATQGVFVGDGIDTLAILRAGQSLAGSTVVSATIAGLSGSAGPVPASINDLGQVAVQAALANGSTGVFRYTPDLHFEPNGGSWNQTHAWTLGLTPAAIHNVFIQPAGNATVTGPTATTTVKSLTIGNSGTGTGDLVLTSNVMLSGNVSVTVQSQGQIDLQAGTLSTPALNLAGALNLSGGTLSATFVNQTGGTLSGSSLALGSGGNPIGTYNLSGGTFASSGSLTLAAGSTFNAAGGTLGTPNFIQNGGTVTGNLVNTTTFTYTSGNFAGRLVNRGTLSGSSLTTGNGVENDATITLGANSLTVNGAGLDNLGSLSLNGGTLSGSGPALNDFGGTLSGSGTLSAALTNNGTLVPLGVLTLTAPASSSGQINLGAQQTLSQSAGLANTGHIELTGGALVGSGILMNNAGGLVHANLPFSGAAPTLSSVGSPLANAGGIIRVEANATLQLAALFGNSSGGQIIVQDGGALNIANAFGNSGVITLNGPSATLAAGGIANNGSLLGVGTVSAPVSNPGIIRAGAGQLTLSGAGNANPIGGQIEAPAGSTVLFAQGLSSNAGTIDLNGGTFDNNHQAITNTGSILGNGVFGSGGLTNAAGAVVNVADVATQFLGTVSNSGSFRITNNTTTFFDPFTNNAGGTVKTTSGTARFLSTFTNNGIYSSDPADNYFTDLTISTSGVLEGGAGDRFFITGNFLNESTQRNAWNTSQSLIDLQAAGPHVVGVAGSDFGADVAGYDDNFAIGTLALDHGGAIVLAGGAGSALYVRTLALVDGVSQVGSIQGNGVSIYYDRNEPGNAYLNGATYTLAGGGTLAPVPEPIGAGIVIGAAVILCRRRYPLSVSRSM